MEIWNIIIVAMPSNTSPLQ